MDGPRDYHTKRTKSERKKQMYNITYMWNLNYNTNKPIYETEIDHRERENKLVVEKGGCTESLELAEIN